jgi:hypothetical protein
MTVIKTQDGLRSWLDMDTIETKLLDLADRLSSVPCIVSIRGDHAGRFLYIVCNERSAEVSLTAQGWWVEFWGSLDEDAQPERASALNSLVEVEAALLDYFFAENAKDS